MNVFLASQSLSSIVEKKQLFDDWIKNAKSTLLGDIFNFFDDVREHIAIMKDAFLSNMSYIKKKNLKNKSVSILGNREICFRQNSAPEANLGYRTSSSRGCKVEYE